MARENNILKIKIDYSFQPLPISLSSHYCIQVESGRGDAIMNCIEISK